MESNEEYVEPGPTREEIDATHGDVVLEFGANECGYCKPHCLTSRRRSRTARISLTSKSPTDTAGHWGGRFG